MRTTSALCAYHTDNRFHHRNVSPITNSVIRFSPDRSRNIKSLSRILPHHGVLMEPPITGISILMLITSMYRPGAGALILSGVVTVTRGGEVRPMVIVGGDSLTAPRRLRTVCRGAKLSYCAMATASPSSLSTLHRHLTNRIYIFTNGSNIKGDDLLGTLSPGLILRAKRVDRGLNHNHRAAQATALCRFTSNCMISAPNFSSISVRRVRPVGGSRLTSYFERFRPCIKQYHFAKYTRCHRPGYTIHRTIRANLVTSSQCRDCITVCRTIGSGGR